MGEVGTLSVTIPPICQLTPRNHLQPFASRLCHGSPELRREVCLWDVLNQENVTNDPYGRDIVRWKETRVRRGF